MPVRWKVWPTFMTVARLTVDLGYWLLNIIGVSDDGNRIIPAFSELYSLAREVTSENQKISLSDS